MLAWLGACPLEARQQIAGLSSTHADVFPTVLATVIALAEYGEFNTFRNSRSNLRYGVATELLEAKGSL